MLVEIVRPSGISFPKFCHNGTNYLLAPKSGKYQIKLVNDTMRRQLAVVSVDGLNVVDGEPAAKKGAGYVLEPHETLFIKGWRRTNEEVAAFEFCEKESSYSGKIGHGTQNTSVIGVAVFDEKPAPYVTKIEIHPSPCRWIPWVVPTIYPIMPVYPEHPPYRIDWSAPEVTCSAGSNNTSSRAVTTNSCTIDLGTAYGKREEMAVTEVSFDACDDPVEVITIRYAVRAKLEEWGVPVKECLKKKTAPDPFPAQRVACRAPSGWIG